MNKEQNARILTDLLEYLKEQHSNLPTHVFEVLGEVIDDLKNKNMVQQEKMRQTGRTTRIVQYVAEQLYNVGTCIATDHVVYEYTPTFKMLHHFKEKVEREIEVKLNGSNSVKSTQITVDGIPYIKFELINKIINL